MCKPKPIAVTSYYQKVNWNCSFLNFTAKNCCLQGNVKKSYLRTRNLQYHLRYSFQEFQPYSVEILIKLSTIFTDSVDCLEIILQLDMMETITLSSQEHNFSQRFALFNFDQKR